MMSSDPNDACPANRLDCAFDTYDPSAGPPREDCPKCWARYNRAHDLPEGNRTAKSSFKPSELDPPAYLTRRCPPVEPLFGHDEAPSHVPRAIRRRAGRLASPVIGLDLSLTSTGLAAVFELEGGGLAVAWDEVGRSIDADASAPARLRRQLDIAAYILDIHEAAAEAGTPEVYVEDHAYRMRGNRSTELRELHGVVKAQYHLATGRWIEPVGISTPRASVWNNGAAGSHDVRRAAEAAGWAWVSRLSEDHLDAVTVALHAALDDSV